VKFDGREAGAQPSKLLKATTSAATTTRPDISTASRRLAARAQANMDSHSDEEREPDGVRLARAVRSARLRDIESMLDSGVAVDTPLPGGFTALLLAAKKGYDEVMALLLDRGAAIDAKTPDGATALHLAAEQYWNVRAARLLLERGAAINEKTSTGASVLEYAIKGDNDYCVKALLEREATIDTKIEHKLLVYVTAGDDTATLKLLLERGVNVDAADEKTGMTPLMYNVSSDHLFPFDNFDYPARPDLPKRIEIIRLLLEAGANPDKFDGSGDHALMYAIDSSDVEGARALIAGGANVNQCSSSGDTPLMYAILEIHRDDRAGYNPSLDMLRLLVSNGADVNHAVVSKENTPYYGTLVSPLWVAVWLNFVIVTRALLEAGADANFTSDVDGNTVLMMAAETGHKRCVEALLEFGADIHKTNNEGRTALQLATTEAVKALLRQHGA